MNTTIDRFNRRQSYGALSVELVCVQGDKTVHTNFKYEAGKITSDCVIASRELDYDIVVYRYESNEVSGKSDVLSEYRNLINATALCLFADVTEIKRESLPNQGAEYRRLTEGIRTFCELGL